MDVTPNSGKGIDAPPPHEACTHAPDLRREMHQVLAPGAERAWLLRRKALMGRVLATRALSQRPRNPPSNSSSTTAASSTWLPARTTPTPSRSRGRHG
ncbi:hypothetical protein FB563_8482 [Streptomyces puniciscabiei]|uniref:Uncharacterized protein n=1 Tax=Streptomyces puniciscabiei TaxID=164348 RepID=A0A542SXS2_9ACTN|nr:hypothetical protein FB563_8482 [Streptomyces puniciscabiei]